MLHHQMSPRQTAQLLQNVSGFHEWLSNPEPQGMQDGNALPATPSWREFPALIHCSDTAGRVFRSELKCLLLKTAAEMLAQKLPRERAGNESLKGDFLCWMEGLQLVPNFHTEHGPKIQNEFLPCNLMVTESVFPFANGKPNYEAQINFPRSFFNGHGVFQSSFLQVSFPLLSKKLPTIVFPFFIDWEKSHNGIHVHKCLNYGTLLLIHHKVIINKDY